MRIQGVKSLDKISDHFFVIKSNLCPQDVLKVVRKMGEVQGEPSYWYLYRAQLAYKGDENSIPKDEFVKVVSQLQEHEIKYEANSSYNRESLIQLLGAKSSARKCDLVEEIIKEKNFYPVRKMIFSKFCKSFKTFTQGEDAITIPVSEEKIIAIHYRKIELQDALLPESRAQYWILSNWGYPSDLQETVGSNAESKCIPEKGTAFLNLKDSDEKLLQAFAGLERLGRIGTLSLKPYGFNVFKKGRSRQNEISYRSDIDYLSGYFGDRKGSKYDTFCHGLRQKKSAELVKKMINKKFLLSHCTPFIGKLCKREDFEALAAHMRVDFAKDNYIIAAVTEKESSELLAAVWNSWGENNRKFYMAQIS